MYAEKRGYQLITVLLAAVDHICSAIFFGLFFDDLFQAEKTYYELI